MKLFAPDRMKVEEALAQMKDHALMVAADIAYRQAEVSGACADCCITIADAIRNLMRPQQ